MPNIEPLYIAILIAIVIGVVWYIQHKKESDAKTKASRFSARSKTSMIAMIFRILFPLTRNRFRG